MMKKLWCILWTCGFHEWEYIHGPYLRTCKICDKTEECLR